MVSNRESAIFPVFPASRNLPCQVKQYFMGKSGKGNRPKSTDDTIATMKRDTEPFCHRFRNRPGDGRLTDKSPALDLEGDFSHKTFHNGIRKNI